MKRIWLGLMAAIVLTIGAIGIMPSETGAEGSEIKLTEEQKNEMADLQKAVINQKKEIINKYVEYGVFTEEKGQKIISHLDKRYNELEKNGFIPQKRHGKHHH